MMYIYMVPEPFCYSVSGESPVTKGDQLSLKHVSAEHIPFSVLCPQKLSTHKQMQNLVVTTKCPIKKNEALEY